MIKTKMNTKNLLVSFVAIVAILSLVATVSAADYTIDAVKVDGLTVTDSDISVIAGETVTVKVYFTAQVDDSDVTIEAEIEGEKVDTSDITSAFDVEADKHYSKVLTLKVPYELKDQKSDDVSLTVEIDGRESKTKTEYTLHVQRPSYNPDVKSITVANTVEAGETFPVEIVVKNIGYNDLDDVYITVSLKALNIEKTAYFGDIVALECCNGDDESCCNEDDEDTISGRLYLKVPYDVETGVYALEVKVSNDDTTVSEVKQILIENAFSSNVVATSTKKTASVGEYAEFSLLLVNPTDKLKVFTVITESNDDLSTNAENAVIAVPAGSSKTVTITAGATSQGEYEFDVNILSENELVDTVTLKLSTEGRTITTAAGTSPIMVLTIILAIVFLVLLVVLIVLIGKKPEKSEEFSESYY